MEERMRKFTKILGVALMLLVVQAAIQAQLTTGSISGTVTDQSGAVVPGATVNIKGENGQNYTTTTNSEGVFQVPGVLAGTPTYTVTVSNSAGAGPALLLHRLIPLLTT